MQNFETNYLPPDAVYLTTKQAFETYNSCDDKSSDKANQCRTKLSWWFHQRKLMDDFLENRGKRYATCTLESYQCTNPLQKNIVRELGEYATLARATLDRGQNVILIGPKGTGKDHLLVALAKRVFMVTGEVPHWRNGVELLEQFHADAMEPKPWRFGNPLTDSKILYLSDILPPSGSLSESKQSALFRVIDSRYSHLKPTWMTLNVADGEEAEQRMGAQVVDRLRDGALVLQCNWESHRKRA
jgi:DNA replication protein DnaC